MQAELAASRGSAGKALIRKYDAAIEKQREQISKVRGQSSSAGCGFSLFGRNTKECAALDTTIERMSANLDALQGKRRRLAEGGSRRDKARILAALDASGCRNETVAPRHAQQLEADREDGRTNLLDKLFSGDTRLLDQLAQTDGSSEERDTRQVLGLSSIPGGGGEFHTSCVRTCDGYFFPMSNAATIGDFERDQKNCESSCPGTEMQVFYSRGMGGDSALMRSSVTGRPYSELPTAYVYKRPDISQPPACGCNAAQNFQVIAGYPPNGTSQPPTDGSPSILTPVSNSDAGADSETQANMQDGLDGVTINRVSVRPVAPPVSTLPPEQRGVRVVGPTFLPDPSAAIDLRAPAPKRVR